MLHSLVRHWIHAVRQSTRLFGEFLALRVFLWETTSYSALSWVRQQIHGQRYADEGNILLQLLTIPWRSVRRDVVWWWFHS